MHSRSSNSSSASNSPAKSSPKNVTFAAFHTVINLPPTTTTVINLPPTTTEDWHCHFSAIPTKEECLRAREIMHQLYDFISNHAKHDAKQLRRLDLSSNYDLIFRLICLPATSLNYIYAIFNKNKTTSIDVANVVTQLKLCVFGQEEFRDHLFNRSKREIEIFAFANFCMDFHTNVKKIYFDNALNEEIKKNYESIYTYHKLEVYILESDAFDTDQKRSLIRDAVIEKIRKTADATEISRMIDELESARYEKIRTPDMQKSFLDALNAHYHKGQQVSFQFMQIIQAAKNKMTMIVMKKIAACQNVAAIKQLIDDIESTATYALIRERNGYTKHSFWGYQYNNQPVSQIFSEIIKAAKDRMLVVAELAANAGDTSELVSLSNPSSPHHQFLSSPRTRFVKPTTNSLELLEDLQLDTGLSGLSALTMKPFQ